MYQQTIVLAVIMCMVAVQAVERLDRSKTDRLHRLQKRFDSILLQASAKVQDWVKPVIRDEKGQDNGEENNALTITCEASDCKKEEEEEEPETESRSVVAQDEDHYEEDPFWTKATYVEHVELSAQEPSETLTEVEEIQNDAAAAIELDDQLLGDSLGTELPPLPELAELPEVDANAERFDQILSTLSGLESQLTLLREAVLDQQNALEQDHELLLDNHDIAVEGQEQNQIDQELAQERLEKLEETALELKVFAEDKAKHDARVAAEQQAELREQRNVLEEVIEREREIEAHNQALEELIESERGIAAHKQELEEMIAQQKSEKALEESETSVEDDSSLDEEVHDSVEESSAEGAESTPVVEDETSETSPVVDAAAVEDPSAVNATTDGTATPSAVEDESAAANGTDSTTPPVGDSATPPADETTAAPADDTTTPPADDTATPPADDTATPPAEDTATPAADETTTSPADDTATPPADETATPPAEDTTTPPAEDTTTPPAESTE